jgi:succinoglycan biosynthesis transport protein ExoP
VRQYIAPILRWWWLILIATLLAGIISVVSVIRQLPVYEVRATLVIGRSFTDPNPNAGEIYLEQQLAVVYANLGSREQIASATLSALGLNFLPTYYVQPVPNTPLIEIIVSDTDPARAVAVANELANQLIQSSPSGKEQQDQSRLSFINDQLQKIQDQIKSTEDEINAAQNKLGTLTSARQISDEQAQISALQQKLVSLQGNYANLLTSTQQGAVNTLALVQAAELPAGPVGPNKLLNILLAILFGFAVSTGAAYGLELLDNSYKTAEEVVDALKVPVLGYIPNITTKANQWTYTSHFPRSPVSDAFRILRTNLEFIAVSRPLRSILIVGPDLSMGKSVIAANLALILSQAEKKVILTDTDLRRPKLSTALEIENKIGISDICLGKASIMNALVPWHNGKDTDKTEDLDKENGDGSKKRSEQLIGLKNSEYLIHFMPAGTIPPNPAEILGSSKFDQLLSELTKFADIVIMDSPPLFLPDASVLLGKADGVIMIVELGRTRKNSIKMAKDQIDRSGANLLGLVLNRVNVGETYYEKYHSYE